MHFTKMGCCELSFVAVIWVFGSLLMVDAASYEVPFDDVYKVVWGGDHVNFLNQRRDVQLWMDITSGSIHIILFNYVDFCVIIKPTTIYIYNVK